MKVWLNGQIVDDETPLLSSRDLGLLHGAGCFTTMRLAGGVIFRRDAHLARLRESCEKLGVVLTYSDLELARAADALLQALELEDARLRLTVTRGTLGSDPQGHPLVTPTVLLTATPFEPYPQILYDRGMTVIVLDQWKLNPYDPQAGHKTLDYFSRFNAMHLASTRSAQEAIWFNVHNAAQGGSLSNLFLVKDGVLVTPPTQAELDADPKRLEQAGYPRSNVLPGITRGAVMDVARSREIDLRLERVTIQDLLEADELFLTNSVMGVMPVCRVERREIGSGKPGEMTLEFRDAIERMHQEG